MERNNQNKLSLGFKAKCGFGRLQQKCMWEYYIFITIFVQRCLICASLLASSGRFLKWRIRISFALGLKKKKKGRKNNQRSIYIRLCAICKQAKAQQEKSHSLLSCRFQASKQSKTATVTVKNHHFNPFCAPHWCRIHLISSPKPVAYPDMGEAHLVATAPGWAQHRRWLFSWGSVRCCPRPNRFSKGFDTVSWRQHRPGF